MPGQVYYIDPASGDDANNGLSVEQAWQTHDGRDFMPGDTVLFKRESVIRNTLNMCNGTEHGCVTYGAYGSGAKPRFMGSVELDDTAHWVEDRPNIWRWQGAFATEVCNLVFNGDESCGNLRWSLDDLKNPGEWFYSGIGFTGGDGGPCDYSDCVLYLCSEGNPEKAYRSIEAVLWGERRLVSGQHHIVLENLAFWNSGVHGFQDCRVEQVTIRNCEFRYIGGAVWDKERRIRFGNAVELWDGARDVVVEDCIFENIYDAGVTHQGSDTSDIPERVYFRNNLFVDCGLASYECRGPEAREIYFENNTSVYAGGGFSMQGEEPPRQSEFYPRPVGHHVFLWRIEGEFHDIYIRNNTFFEAPYGAAIYSIIDADDEKGLIIDNNRYWQTTGDMLIYMQGKTYGSDEFDRYKQELGQDKHSIIAKPVFTDDALLSRL
ncbi:MAG: right-handed parallel beta-helix repeat-containing protein [Sedimentisphaerales bacterium]|nr:right-handed parallel beta-helix repeat-containing protein [Sedimentisphaerales bacterium]